VIDVDADEHAVHRRQVGLASSGRAEPVELVFELLDAMVLAGPAQADTENGQARLRVPGSAASSAGWSRHSRCGGAGCYPAVTFFRSSCPVTWMVRGLACSCTGMDRVSTPAL